MKLDISPSTASHPCVRTSEPGNIASLTDTTPTRGDKPRFHFFIIDSGWKSVSSRVIRKNFRMIREFQSNDPLYVLNREQSVSLIRSNPDWIGKDPIIMVHDLLAQKQPSPSGYYGFRLCLGLIKDGEQAVTAMQDFLRFVSTHRRSLDIEKQIQDQLHRQGWRNTMEVLRHGASEFVGG